MIDKIIRYVLIGLLVIAVAGDIYFIMGKGINIDKSTHMTTHQHQEQYQGQVSINYFQAYGSKLKWKLVQYDKLDDALTALNLLPDQYAVLSSKPTYLGNGKWGNWIPEFMTETKK